MTGSSWSTGPGLAYADFLATKQRRAGEFGHAIDPAAVHPMLHDWQKEIVTWAVRKGRVALWEDTGLGKTVQLLQWARFSGDTSLIVAPLAVSAQTVREASKVDMHVRYVRSGEQITGPGVWVTNYEMIDRFDPKHLDAVVLDEAGVSYRPTRRPVAGKRCVGRATVHRRHRTAAHRLLHRMRQPVHNLELQPAVLLAVMPKNERDPTPPNQARGGGMTVIPRLVDHDGSIKAGIEALRPSRVVDETPAGRLAGIDGDTWQVYIDMYQLLTTPPPEMSPLTYEQRLSDLAEALVYLHKRGEQAYRQRMEVRMRTRAQRTAGGF